MVPEGMRAQIKRKGKRALQRFADCDVKLMLFAPSQGGKKLHKSVICIFWLPLLRSVSWASSVTEQGSFSFEFIWFLPEKWLMVSNPLFSCCTSFKSFLVVLSCYL